ncbi:MAG: cysteine hydrolase, partial [Pseudomonadota bacterium]|nr:cysteine hydrolase [Pseudomonadota bacterium]
ALPVAGAHADMLRVAELIRSAGRHLDAITVTLDAHHRIDIAHPGFWRDRDGVPPTPFTQISADQVRAGAYRTARAEDLPRALSYLDALEASERYRLIIWPVHCEIGSWGQNIHFAVRAAYNHWEIQRQRSVEKVLKGSNPWTEHYSAVQAEVPDLADPATASNTALLASLTRADTVYIAGEAGSHCVKATTEHIVATLTPQQCAHLVLITDCISPVSGFEQQQADFIAAMRARGVRLATCAEVTAELLAQPVEA